MKFYHEKSPQVNDIKLNTSPEFTPVEYFEELIQEKLVPRSLGVVGLILIV